AKFFLQFVYLLGQPLGFLAIFLLVGLVELITEIEDLAIGLGFSLIATDDADDLLCQFGSIGLLSLSKQRRRGNNQNPQDQQPVHKFPRDSQATIPQKTVAVSGSRSAAKCSQRTMRADCGEYRQAAGRAPLRHLSRASSHTTVI